MQRIDLRNRKTDLDAFLKYGFIKDKDTYTFHRRLEKHPFTAYYILKGSIIFSYLIDDAFMDEYVIVDQKDKDDGYSGHLKEEYNALTENILSACTVKILTQRERIIQKTIGRYQGSLDFPFEKSPYAAVIRKKKSRKWYCLFLRVKASVLSIETNDTIDILNLRGDEERISAIDKKTIFPAYHMNKAHWFTVILDDRLNDEEIMELIDKSYQLVR